MCFKFIIHSPLLDKYGQYFLSWLADWFTCEIWINLITNNNMMELYAEENYLWDSAVFVPSIMWYFSSSRQWEHHMKVEREAMREERRFFWKKVKVFTLLGLDVGTTRSSSLHHCGLSVGLTVLLKIYCFCYIIMGNKWFFALSKMSGLLHNSARSWLIS